MESSDNDGCSDLASRFMRDTDSDSSLMSASEAEVFDPLVPEEHFNVCCDAFGPEVAFGFEPPRPSTPMISLAMNSLPSQSDVELQRQRQFMMDWVSQQRPAFVLLEEVPAAPRG